MTMDGMDGMDGIETVIEDAKNQARADSDVAAGRTGKVLRDMGERRGGISTAWLIRQPNKIFLHLFKENGELPISTYRISFSFPLTRVTAWEYAIPASFSGSENGGEESLESILSSKNNEDLLKKSTPPPKKIKLGDFFTLIIKLKKAILQAHIAPDQLTFTLNRTILTDGPIAIIDYICYFYQHRKVDQALTYAKRKSAKRFMAGVKGQGQGQGYGKGKGGGIFEGLTVDWGEDLPDNEIEVDPQGAQAIMQAALSDHDNMKIKHEFESSEDEGLESGELFTTGIVQSREDERREDGDNDNDDEE